MEAYRLGRPRAPARLLADVASFLEPVRPGRADERRLQPKGAVYFAYRAA